MWETQKWCETTREKNKAVEEKSTIGSLKSLKVGFIWGEMIYAQFERHAIEMLQEIFQPVAFYSQP